MRAALRTVGLITGVCVMMASGVRAQQDTTRAWPEAGSSTSSSSSGSSGATTLDGAGIRAGIGTDISGGIAFGGGVNYTKIFGLNGLELSLDVFGGSFEETTTEVNTYTEKTDILVVAVMANYLLQYDMSKSKVYFAFGFGAGAISVEWEESSPDDVSLGTPLPGGGSKQEEDGTSGGSIINLGIGLRATPKLDFRLQAPIFFVWSAPGESSGVVPTIALTAGLRF